MIVEIGCECLPELKPVRPPLAAEAARSGFLRPDESFPPEECAISGVQEAAKEQAAASAEVRTFPVSAVIAKTEIYERMVVPADATATAITNTPASVANSATGASGSSHFPTSRQILSGVEETIPTAMANSTSNGKYRVISGFANAPWPIRTTQPGIPAAGIVPRETAPNRS